MKGAPMLAGVCANCSADVYMNRGAQREVREWVHRATGSRYCNRTERTTATVLLDSAVAPARPVAARVAEPATAQLGAMP